MAKLEIGDYAIIVEKPEFMLWSAFSMPYRGVVQVCASPRIVYVYYDHEIWEIQHHYQVHILSWAKLWQDYNLLQGGMNTQSLNENNLEKISEAEAFAQIIEEDKRISLPYWHKKDTIKKPQQVETAKAMIS